MLSVSETSPVEAGEVARAACRRGGDLPRGFAYCYSAINANAFETVVLAIVAQLQSPYEYLR